MTHRTLLTSLIAMAFCIPGTLMAQDATPAPAEAASKPMEEAAKPVAKKVEEKVVEKKVEEKTEKMVEKKAKKKKGNPMAKGAWSFGADTTFNYTSSSNDVPGGKPLENSTLFLRLTPQVGYFIIENLELSLSAGVLLRQLDRGNNENTPETNVLMELSGKYFTPPYKGFSMFLGAGLGGYVGSSERTITIVNDQGESSLKEENTDTVGFSATASLGASYLFRHNLQLRAGLALSGLVGNETIPNVKNTQGVSTFNAGLTVGVHYVF